MVTGVVPSSHRFLPSIFLAHRVHQQSRCSSIFHRAIFALSASQFVRKNKSQRIYTSMHSAWLELTKLTYTRLEDELIRHRGDRLYTHHQQSMRNIVFLGAIVTILWHWSEMRKQRTTTRYSAATLTPIHLLFRFIRPLWGPGGGPDPVAASPPLPDPKRLRRRTTGRVVTFVAVREGYSQSMV